MRIFILELRKANFVIVSDFKQKRTNFNLYLDRPKQMEALQKA